MSVCKASAGIAIFVAVCLLGGAADSAHAQCTVCAVEWSHGKVINLGGLPGSTVSIANDINDRGQAVGYSFVGGVNYATEWTSVKIIDLGPGVANSINDAGQVVGLGPGGATEWSGGK